MTVDNRQQIAQLRESMESEIGRALSAVRSAVGTIAELRSDSVYDIEFAEGSGADIAHHLDAAARSLRAADALRKATP
jgi:hypothetical protein